jgi:hypothetical protein
MNMPSRKRRKLNPEDDSISSHPVPEKMTIPEIQAYLMEYNVPCPNVVSKAEFVKIFKEKVVPKIKQSSSTPGKSRLEHMKKSSSRKPPSSIHPFSPSRGKNDPNAMEVDNGEQKSRRKKRTYGRTLFQFGKSPKRKLWPPKHRFSAQLTQEIPLFSSSSQHNASTNEKKEIDTKRVLSYSSRTLSQPTSTISRELQPRKGIQDEGRYALGNTRSKWESYLSQKSASEHTLGTLRKDSFSDSLVQETQKRSSSQNSSDPKVVQGNKIQQGENVFCLGDRVSYKGTTGWRIVGMDFDYLTLNIQKGVQVKNTVPKFLTRITDCEVQKSDSRIGQTMDSLCTPNLNIWPNLKKLKPKTTYCGRRFACTLTLMFFVLFGVLAYIFRQPTLNFCDFQNSNAEELSCTPCPKNATCRNGRAVCGDNYDLHWDVCKETKQLEKYIFEIIQTAHLVLKEKKGEAECRLGPK